VDPICPYYGAKLVEHEGCVNGIGNGWVLPEHERKVGLSFNVFLWAMAFFWGEFFVWALIYLDKLECNVFIFIESVVKVVLERGAQDLSYALCCEVISFGVAVVSFMSYTDLEWVHGMKCTKCEKVERTAFVGIELKVVKCSDSFDFMWFGGGGVVVFIFVFDDWMFWWHGVDACCW
jgi:hypothetical protein